MTKEEKNKILTHLADWQYATTPAETDNDMLRLLKTIKIDVLEEVYKYIESIDTENICLLHNIVCEGCGTNGYCNYNSCIKNLHTKG